MLSRAVDRAFVGMTVKRPAYSSRKVTGLFLLPLTFAVDVATFPIQAILVVILGDNFPFKEEPTLANMTALNTHPMFQKLGPAQQATARTELAELLRAQKLTPSTALALGEDGHWTLVPLTAGERTELIARSQALEGKDGVQLVQR
jgi:hypothetical protein